MFQLPDQPPAASACRRGLWRAGQALHRSRNAPFRAVKRATGVFENPREQTYKIVATLFAFWRYLLTFAAKLKTDLIDTTLWQILEK
jgi:hypothetical protein